MHVVHVCQVVVNCHRTGQQCSKTVDEHRERRFCMACSWGKRSQADEGPFSARETLARLRQPSRQPDLIQKPECYAALVCNELPGSS